MNKEAFHGIAGGGGVGSADSGFDPQGADHPSTHSDSDPGVMMSHCSAACSQNNCMI